MDNPYWDAVKDHVETGHLFGETQQVQRWNFSGGKLSIDGYPQRDEWVHNCSWTITDPDSIEFVAKYAQEGLVDPMAGTGYWAYVLGQLGVDVVCYDKAPGDNEWHIDGKTHVDMTAMNGWDSVALHQDRTLLLSWPPYDEDVGTRILAAYQGQRVIYMGEGVGGCTGDSDMHDQLDQWWHALDERVPVQWEGLHDRITIYERREV